MRKTTYRLIRWLASGVGRALWRRPDLSRYEAVGYVHLGRVPLDTDAVGDLLPPFGYPAPHDSLLTYGGGGYGRTGRQLVGGDGLGGGAARVRRRFRTTSGAGMGMAFSGHLAFARDNWRIYPFAGVGGQGQGFGVRPRDGAPDGDRPVLPSGGTGGVAGFAGWTTEYQMRLHPRAGLLIGVRVGWIIVPLRLPWFPRGFGDVRLPLPRLARPYVNLLAGVFVDSETV